MITFQEVNFRLSFETYNNKYVFVSDLHAEKPDNVHEFNRKH